MNKDLPNGGFPPIKYCDENNKTEKKMSKDRHFSSNYQKNVNIKYILAESKKPFIITGETNNDELDEVD